MSSFLRWSLAGLELDEQVIEPVEAAVPELSVGLQPLVRVSQRLGDDATRTTLRVTAAGDETRLLEHLEVLGDRRLAHGKRRGELGHRRLAPFQPGKDRTTSRIGQRCERRIELLRGRGHACPLSITPQFQNYLVIYPEPRSVKPVKMTDVSDLSWMSAVEQRTLLEHGDVTAGELRDAGIAACEALDPALGFLVTPLFDRAPPGVPMLLKDAGQEIAGTPHYVGVAALRDSGSRSSTTTALAARFEELGFSIIGKAACPALSTAITTEPPGFPPTRNPWDVTRSAGGSSGGSAAAVAAGAVAVAHGSDATGSLRCPAAVCGVITLNPTSGRIASVPPAGQPPIDAWRDFVIARYAMDLTMVFEALAGSHVVRSDTPLRIGVLDHDREMGIAVDSACVEGMHRVGRLLESLGHHVEPGWPTVLDHLWRDTFAALSVAADSTRPTMIAWVGERLGRPVERGELAETVFESADRAAARSDDDVRAAQETIERVVAPLDEWWEDFDILLTPSTFQPAWPLGGSPGPRELGTLAAPFSLSRQPSLSVPAGWSADGLPVGAQLVARRGNDELLLDLAVQLQDADDWTTRRPPV